MESGCLDCSAIVVADCGKYRVSSFIETAAVGGAKTAVAAVAGDGGGKATDASRLSPFRNAPDMPQFGVKYGGVSHM